MFRQMGHNFGVDVVHGFISANCLERGFAAKFIFYCLPNRKIEITT